MLRRHESDRFPRELLTLFFFSSLLGACAEPSEYEAGRAHAAAAASYAQPPPDQPGLGTRWGEERKSAVREIRFVRATPNQPLAVAKIFYNDRAGSKPWRMPASYGAPGRPSPLPRPVWSRSPFAIRAADCFLESSCVTNDSLLAKRDVVMPSKYGTGANAAWKPLYQSTASTSSTAARLRCASAATSSTLIAPWWWKASDKAWARSQLFVSVRCANRTRRRSITTRAT